MTALILTGLLSWTDLLAFPKEEWDSIVREFEAGHGAAVVLITEPRSGRIEYASNLSRALNLVYVAIRSRSTELSLAFGLAFALMLAASTLLYFVESTAQPEAFGSIPRAMWWAVETLTTVGYGDVVPVTPLGRFLAAVTALCGIGIIALPTGMLAGAFSDAIRQAREDRTHGGHGD